ncbi:DUF881 domain-containing protein [Gleimia hominis]|uniref:DUF881 domain-containing protein n=1 Tax=Gleimia hominis TaxID=595468 RepID=UPI000C805F4A|nr:DUF881 domain-containing protein [Gleimia hominis]WIK64201.1 DUF881 domain-containing protein [Gleimia hominis]
MEQPAANNDRRGASKKVTAMLARFLVPACAGLLFMLPHGDPHGTARYTGTDVHALVMKKQQVVNQIKTENQQLRGELTTQLNKQLENQGPANATEPSVPSGITGSGITVTLTDAVVPDTLPKDTNVDDLVIHQQDIEATLNALWTGGAEAVSVQGNNVTMTSTIRCVGNVINIDGHLYSPPYEISAIGNNAQLHRALNNDPQIQVIQAYVVRYGLGFSVKDNSEITIKTPEKMAELKYAKAME